MGCLLCTALLLVACRQQTNEKVTQSEGVQTSLTSCYASIQGNQVTAIKLIEKGKEVNGYIAFEWPGSDETYYGDFTGTRTGDQFTVMVHYILKGEPKTEEVIFRRTGMLLLQARGELIPINGRMVLKDKNNLIWAFSYDLTDCTKVAAPLDRAVQERKVGR